MMSEKDIFTVKQRKLKWLHRAQNVMAGRIALKNPVSLM